MEIKFDDSAGFMSKLMTSMYTHISENVTRRISGQDVSGRPTSSVAQFRNNNPRPAWPLYQWGMPLRKIVNLVVTLFRFGKFEWLCVQWEDEKSRQKKKLQL